MSIEFRRWCEVNAGELHRFSKLLEDKKLNEVFYPVPEPNPGSTGLFSLNFPNYSTHPLHPDYKPKPRFSTGPGLLSLSVELPPESFDFESEKLQQDARVKAYKKEVESHPIYRLLGADVNFKQARETFKNKQRMENPGLYVHPFAEFRFIEAIVSNVGFFMISDGSAFDWQTPNKKAIRKARDSMLKVLASFEKDGIEIRDDIIKQSALKSLLSELSTQLENQLDTSRAAWGGKNRPYRVFIYMLAKRLNQHFGKVSPNIVKSLAAMVDCPFDERTITNQLKAAASDRQRRESANALRGKGKNSSKFG